MSVEYCLKGINCNNKNCTFNHMFPIGYCPNNNYCKNSLCKLLHSKNTNISCKHGIKCLYSHCAYNHIIVSNDIYIKNNLCPMGITCSKQNTCKYTHLKYLLPNYKLLSSNAKCSFINCNNPLCVRKHTDNYEPLRHCIFGYKCPNINVCCYEHYASSLPNFTYINKLFKNQQLDFLTNVSINNFDIKKEPLNNSCDIDTKKESVKNSYDIDTINKPVKYPYDIDTKKEPIKNSCDIELVKKPLYDIDIEKELVKKFCDIEIEHVNKPYDIDIKKPPNDIHTKNELVKYNSIKYNIDVCKINNLFSIIITPISDYNTEDIIKTLLVILENSKI